MLLGGYVPQLHARHVTILEQVYFVASGRSGQRHATLLPGREQLDQGARLEDVAGEGMEPASDPLVEVCNGVT
ncbi:hypothetical protein KO116_01504 [Halomonas sp. KO116]|nr:hypothetical protein KO116_01504 [Halomonas sp. KO116]